MDDRTIIDLFWQRDERAIPATAAKYGGYCAAIARNLLTDESDTEECLNDTWLRAWNAIPPQRPQSLSVFLGRICRNLALNRLRHDRALRRGGGQLPFVLEELDACIADHTTVEGRLDEQELAQAINDFLARLPRRLRQIFVLRYFYTESTAAIAQKTGMSQTAVTSSLSRIRAKLKIHLTERGFFS